MFVSFFRCCEHIRNCAYRGDVRGDGQILLTGVTWWQGSLLRSHSEN